MADEEHYQRDDGAEAFLDGGVWAWTQPVDYDHIHFETSAERAMAAADAELEAVVSVLLQDGMAGTRESALWILRISGLLRAITPDDAATRLTRGVNDSDPHLNRQRARKVWVAIGRPVPSSRGGGGATATLDGLRGRVSKAELVRAWKRVPEHPSVAWLVGVPGEHRGRARLTTFDAAVRAATELARREGVVVDVLPLVSDDRAAAILLGADELRRYHRDPDGYDFGKVQVAPGR